MKNNLTTKKLAEMLKLVFLLVVGSYSINLDELLSEKSRASPEVETLYSEGYLVVSNCLSSELVTDLSTELSKCAKQNYGIDGDILRSSVLDGSLRSTFASESSSDKEFSFCGENVEALVSQYKQRTQEIGGIVARLLDVQIGAQSSHRIPLSLENVVSDSNSSSLDHFHVYSAKQRDSDETGSLPVPFHVDMGLFLILSPAVAVSDAGSGQLASTSGLLIKRADGSVFELEVTGLNSVIVLMGSGIVNWMHADLNWRPAMHAVKPVTGDMDRVALARMFLPNMDEVVNEIKFGDFFHQPSQVDSKWRRLSDENCAAGEIYCWMNCLPEPDCAPGVEPVCANVQTGKICPDGDTCDCDLMCPEPPTTLVPDSVVGKDESIPSALPVKLASTNEKPFCRGATSMVMSGFESVASANAHCIILFFQPWILDTPWKFALGCIGMILAGMLVESIIKARRLITNSKRITSKPLKDAIVIFLFAVNITLGYLCMLAAMTFNVEIFVCTVIGLSIGHLVLGNIHQPVRESADACCVSSEPNFSAVKTSLRNSTGACCCNEP